MEIKKSCLDCTYANFEGSTCDWGVAGSPPWARILMFNADLTISEERPYLDCDAWEQEEKNNV